MKIEIEVTCCKDCPYKRNGQDHGATFVYCAKKPHYLNDELLTVIDQDCPFKEEANK